MCFLFRFVAFGKQNLPGIFIRNHVKRSFLFIPSLQLFFFVGLRASFIINRKNHRATAPKW